MIQQFFCIMYVKPAFRFRYPEKLENLAQN